MRHSSDHTIMESNPLDGQGISGFLTGAQRPMEHHS